jgi:hypothetical protein
MTLSRLPILTLFAIVTAPGSAIASDSLILDVRDTTAVVQPRSARLRVIDLPDLEFALRAVLRCAGQPVSLTFSIADTLATLDSGALQDQRAAEATLTVPAQQIALAASKRFCVAGDDESGDELLVPGLTTAHASLHCSHDGHVSAHFASTPVNLRLSCERAADETQEASPASSER